MPFMGGVDTVPRSSLERLKALDQLSSLDAQVDEATKLCTHGARAEMIVKWTVDKLRQSSEARINTSIWTLLALAIRLLSSSRIATLLGSISFHDVLLATLSETKLSRPCMTAIEELVNLLLQIGSSPGATAVKAVLGADNAKAASFCGAWLRCLIDHYCNSGNNDTIHQSEDKLNVATAVWALRKSQGDDDALFTDHCLVHVLELLAIFERDGQSSIVPKRSHNDILKSVSHSYHELRLLIARHCILPARASFNAARESTPRRPLHEVQEQSRATLDDKLKVLRTRLTHPNPQSALNGIPLLLEVALLCIATPTPRHRDREQPWVDHLFTALVDCLFSVDVSTQAQLGILTAILEVIRRHGSLSSSTLGAMARDHVFQTLKPASRSHWYPIMKVVEIDVDVLTDASLAAHLFDAISEEVMSEVVDVDFTASIKSQILEPVMAAFASGRGVDRFIALWDKQLFRVRDYANISIWDQLLSPFAKLLQSTLSPDQFLKLFEASKSPIKAITISEVANNTEELNAKLTLVNAFLEGAKTDELVDLIHNAVYELLQSLLEIPGLLAENQMSGLGAPYWICLTGSFNLWFPLWASQQQDDDAVRQMLYGLATNHAFKAALALCKQRRSVSSSSNKHRLPVQQAGCYAMTICEAGIAFEDQPLIKKACEKTATCMATTYEQFHCLFAKFPGLLAFISTSDRERFFQEVLEAASESTLDDVRAFSHTVMSHATTDIRECWITVLFKYLNHEEGNKVEKLLYGRAIEAALSIPSSSLTREQRDVPLKALVATSHALAAAGSSRHFQKYLAWILHLLHAPNVQPSQHLSLQQLWQFGQAVDARPKLTGTHNDTVRKTLGSLAGKVIGSWIVRQAQQKTNKELVEFSETIERHLSDVKSDVDDDRPAASVIAKVFIGMLYDSQFEQYTKGIAMRSSNTMQLYLERQLKDASRMARQLKKHPKRDNGALWRNLCDILETATAAPMNSTSKIDKYYHSFLDLASEISSGSPLDEFESTRRLAVINGFRLASKDSNGANINLFTAAAKLLNEHLSASDYHEVITAVSKAFQNSTVSTRTYVLSELFKAEHDLSIPYLVLRQAVVADLIQEDADKAEDPTSANLLLRTLAVVAEHWSVQATRYALQTTNIILREKRFLVSQHGIEHTISTLHRLSSQSPYIAALYGEICQSIVLILTHYRTRVQDRMHLLVALLQEALLPLFQSPSSASPKPRLTARHAHAYTRLLIVLCNRHVPARARGKTSVLVDEARKAQARTGQYVQFILHRYCAAVLGGALDTGIREALQPGLWAVIEAIEVSGADGIKALSAAMNHSERAVLRSVYDEWRRFGKWEGL